MSWMLLVLVALRIAVFVEYAEWHHAGHWTQNSLEGRQHSAVVWWTGEELLTVELQVLKPLRHHVLEDLLDASVLRAPSQALRLPLVAHDLGA